MVLRGLMLSIYILELNLDGLVSFFTRILLYLHSKSGTTLLNMRVIYVVLVYRLIVLGGY